MRRGDGVSVWLPRSPSLLAVGERDDDIAVQVAACREQIAALSAQVATLTEFVSGAHQAVMLGLTRALVKINGEWNSAMRKAGLLTRDARIKERKKPGLKRARKAPTYTKR